jgi:hypothetical protein
MNKIIKIFILLVTFQSLLFAHSLLLDVFDNEDNTIQVEGIFSTGEPASGAQILLESLIDGKILYKKRLPVEGELTIVIPKEEYQVILNGGPGHKIIKKGIAPKNGFVKKSNSEEIIFDRVGKNNSRNDIIYYGLTCAFFLLFFTIFISIRNTNKIITILRENTK